MADDNSGPEVVAAVGPGHAQIGAAPPNRLWIADLTYSGIWRTVAYAAFTVTCSAATPWGWRVYISLRTELVLDALGQAPSCSGHAT